MHRSHTHQAGIPHTGTKAGFQVQGDYKDPERGPHQGLPSLTLPPGAAAGGGARLGRGRWAFPVVPSRQAGWESPPHSSERKTPEARLLRNWGDVTAGGSRGAAAGHRERGQRDSACGARPTASLSRLAAWYVKGLREYTKAATRPRVQRRGPRAGGAAGPVAWPASARARGLTGTRLRLRELARPAKGQWRPQADVGDRRLTWGTQCRRRAGLCRAGAGPVGLQRPRRLPAPGRYLGGLQGVLGELPSFSASARAGSKF